MRKIAFRVVVNNKNNNNCNDRYLFWNSIRETIACTAHGRDPGEGK